MKSLVVKINNKSFALNDFIEPYIIKPLFVAFLYFSMFSRFEGVGGLTGGMTAVLLSAALFGIAVVHMLLFSKKKGFSALAYLMVVFFFVAAITPLISALIYGVRVNYLFRFVIELGVNFAMFYLPYHLFDLIFLNKLFACFKFPANGLSEITFIFLLIKVSAII